NKSLANKWLFILFLVLMFFIIRKFFQKNEPIYSNQSICLFFHEDSIQNEYDIRKILNKTDVSFFDQFDIFQLRFVEPTQNLDIVKIEQKTDEIKKKCEEILNNILKSKKFYFYFSSNISENDKIATIKDFFSIKVGSNQNYLEEKKYSSNNIGLKYFDTYNKKFEKPKVFQLYNDEDEQKKQVLDTFAYNKLIKEKTSNKSQKLFLGVKEKTSAVFQVYVDDTGDLPIQWPSKYKWSYALGWGYIWNFLIVFIGYFLSFFSSIFSSSEPGYFFGNIGLGIILTTLLVRTLLWPIYTKMSSFSMKMSLAQPEINKVQAKYSFKKDSATTQQMQMEIFKVYRKYNISFLEILITFVQMPILIAMFRTLKRIFVKGGIFDFCLDYNYKPFLGFIKLGLNNNNDYSMIDLITKILLSLLVGVTMFWLNKINLQKPTYQKKNVQVFDLEQKIKQQQQEKTLKIVNYIMICFMAFTAYKEITMALYWLIGNLYTIGQTLINRQIMKKKYDLLKNQGF
ncbi:hypothetical protein C6B37_02595, partial [Candidatus Phytoplasma phoenicium]